MTTPEHKLEKRFCSGNK